MPASNNMGDFDARVDAVQHKLLLLPTKERNQLVNEAILAALEKLSVKDKCCVEQQMAHLSQSICNLGPIKAQELLVWLAWFLEGQA